MGEVLKGLIKTATFENEEQANEYKTLLKVGQVIAEGFLFAVEEKTAGVGKSIKTVAQKGKEKAKFLAAKAKDKITGAGTAVKDKATSAGSKVKETAKAYDKKMLARGKKIVGPTSKKKGPRGGKVSTSDKARRLAGYGATAAGATAAGGTAFAVGRASKKTASDLIFRYEDEEEK